MVRAHEHGLVLKTKSISSLAVPSPWVILQELQAEGRVCEEGRILPICCHPLGARVLGCGKAPHCSEHSPAGSARERGGGSVSFCCSLHGTLWEREGSLIFMLRQAGFLQYCLPQFCNNYPNRNHFGLWGGLISFDTLRGGIRFYKASIRAEGRSWEHTAASTF